jgi:hypothetical protein
MIQFQTWVAITLISILSLSAIAPAIAEDVDSSSQTESTTIDKNSGTVKGTVKSIIGSVVIVDVGDGKTTTLSVSKDQIATYNLRPGMYLVANQTNGVTVIESVNYTARANPESETATRILNIKPEVRTQTTSDNSNTTDTYTDTSTSGNNSVTTPVSDPLPTTPRALW